MKILTVINNLCVIFPSLTSGCSLCSISNQNLLAFTTVTTVTDTTANSWGSHVYVADLNSPWLAHKYLKIELLSRIKKKNFNLKIT